MKNLSANAALGVACIAFALLTAFVWVPLDTNTWLVERARGRFTVGDSLAPTLAAVFILVAGLMLLREGGGDGRRPSLQNLRYIGIMILFGAVAMLLMRWVGPLLTPVMTDGGEYRLLRDTPPWKYLGFAIGGGFLVCAMVSLVEEKVSAKALLIGVVAVAGIILLYDLPFEDVLLPPNGDV